MPIRRLSSWPPARDAAIRDFGVWAHYVGDASQPLHVSVHYDVWGDGPNPEGFSTVKGLVGYPPLAVKDVEAGTVDALAMMQGAE